jgi:hypothetical protein
MAGSVSKICVPWWWIPNITHFLCGLRLNKSFFCALRVRYRQKIFCFFSGYKIRYSLIMLSFLLWVSLDPCDIIFVKYVQFREIVVCRVLDF